MIKKISAIVLAIVMLCSLAACAGVTKKEVNLATIKSEILEKTGAEPLELDEDNFYRSYGIEASKLKTNESYVVLTEALFPDEVILVEAVDEEAAKFVVEQLEAHLEDTMSQATGYDEAGLAIAKGTKVIQNGNYVAMFFSQDREEMEAIYNSYF